MRIEPPALQGLDPRRLRAMMRGIEKESLRVTPQGQLAATPHPLALGSALTHPHITTDYSEAQLELITGVHPSPQACLQELRECPPAPGFSRVEVPGEREAELRRERLLHGILLPPQTLAALSRLGQRLCVDASALGELRACAAAVTRKGRGIRRRRCAVSRPRVWWWRCACMA